MGVFKGLTGSNTPRIIINFTVKENRICRKIRPTSVKIHENPQNNLPEIFSGYMYVSSNWYRPKHDKFSFSIECLSDFRELMQYDSNLLVSQRLWHHLLLSA